MSIHFVCLNCEHEMLTATVNMGRGAPCPNCNSPIRVPAKADLEPTDDFMSPVSESPSDIVNLEESNYNSPKKPEEFAEDLVRTIKVDQTMAKPVPDEKPLIQAIEVSQKLILESLQENNAPLKQKRFRNYELLEEINRGGMGVIYSAKNLESGQRVAVKFMLQDESDPFLIKRFRREAAALSKLIHPNIVSILEFGEDHDTPYIVMELIEGMTLEERIRRQKGGAGAYQVPDESVSSIFAPLAEALSLCHEHGIIHRDLKPDNIILEAGTDRPVLLDFGLVTYDPEHYSNRLSTFYQHITGSDQLVGTPAFMSPEQVDAEAYGSLTAASDVWSLMSCLYTYTTGSLPYDFRSLPELLMTLTSEIPALPSSRVAGTETWIDDLCRRAFHLDPSLRPTMSDLSKYLWAKRVPEEHQSSVVPAVTSTGDRTSENPEVNNEIQAEPEGGGSRRGLTVILVVIIALFAVILAMLGQRYMQTEALRKEFFAAFDKGEWRVASKALDELLLANPDDPFLKDQARLVSEQLSLLERREKVSEYLARAKNAEDSQDQVELVALAFDSAANDFGLYSEVFDRTEQMAEELERNGRAEARRRFLKTLIESAYKGDRFSKLTLSQRLTLSDHMTLTSRQSKALELYKSVVKQDPASWQASYAQGKVQEIRAEYERAKGHYRSALNQNRRSLRTLRALARLHFRSRAFTEAQALTQRALNLDKDDAESYVLRAQIRMAQEDYLFAKEDLDSAVKLSKGHARAWGLLAQWSLHQKKAEQALGYADQALALDPRCAEASLAKAEYYVKAKQNFDKALQECVVAEKHAPKNALVHYWKGRVYQERKQSELAIRAYRECLKLDPYQWRAYCNRGTLHRLAKRYDKAISDLNQAIYLQPRNDVVILQRSKVLWIQLRSKGVPYTDERWVKVIDELGKILRINARSASAYGRRAFLKRRRGKPQEALADYDRAVALKTDDQYLWAGYRGLLYAELQDHEKAVADFNRYLAKASSTHGLYGKIRKLREQSKRKLDRN